jgi:DNA-binding transcriptional LysR family regulator
MDINLLSAFVILAETRNYRIAAERLFITQPALTKKIKSLENDLGMTLFVRGRQGARLTHAGEQLLEKSRELVALSDTWRQYARNVAQGTTGHLKIGFGISGIKIAPALVARFRQMYPDVSLSLEDISSSQQTALLLSGQLQLAFMRLPVDPPLTGCKITSESLALAVKHKSLWCTAEQTADPPDYQFLASQPLIQLLAEKGLGLYRQINRFLSFNNILPTIVQQSRDIQTVMALVAAGVGIAIVPESAANIAPEGIEMIPLAGPYTHWDVGMIWNPLLDDPLRDRFIGMVNRPDNATQYR